MGKYCLARIIRPQQLGYQLPLWGQGFLRLPWDSGAQLPSSVGPAAPLIDIPAIVGIIEVYLGVFANDIVFDPIGAFVPVVTTMPRILQVVYVGTQSRTPLDPIHYLFPLVIEIWVISEEPSYGAMKGYHK